MTAHNAEMQRPRFQRDDNDKIDDARTKYDEHQQGQNQAGNRHLNIGQPRKEGVDLSPPIARPKASRHANDERRNHGQDSNQQRRSAAPDDPGEHITPDQINSKRMSGAGWTQHRHQILFVRIEW